MRRLGDTVLIEGTYQHQALQSGNPVQRFWHYNKLVAIDQIMPPSPTDFVLDVGCGSGVVADHLGKGCRRVIGIDGNREAIHFARAQFKRDHLIFLEALVDEAFETNEPVDKVYSLELIEHVYFAQGLALLKNCRRILKPDGLVFLTTPNYHSLWPAIEWTMDRLRLAPQMGGHQHVEYYHRHKLQKLADEAGFSVLRLATGWLLSPWLAPLLGDRAATALSRLELKALPVGGSLLVAVLQVRP